jgi:hypothetical protein
VEQTRAIWLAEGSGHFLSETVGGCQEIRVNMRVSA